MEIKLETLYWIVFNLFLSVGCFWQIFHVIDLFLKYPTNVFIKTKFEPLSKPLPAITLVTNIGSHSLLDSTEAMETESGIYKNRMFHDIYIKDSNGVRHSLLKEYLDTAIERVSFNYYTITLNSALTAKNNETTWLKWNEEIYFYLKVWGNNNNWWLHLHNSYDMPSSYDWNTIEIKNKIRHRITWKLDTFRLLESPYRTDCKIYRNSSSYLSRKDCIRNCKLRISTEKCGHIWEEIDWLRDEKSVRFGDSDNKSCIKDIDFVTKCSEECPHSDCFIEYFEPIKTFEWFYQEFGSFFLQIPTKPETAYYHKPSIETIEFICYLASTVSLYFGLSLYSVHSLLSLFCKHLLKVVHKYQITMPIQITVQKPIRIDY